MNIELQVYENMFNERPFLFVMMQYDHPFYRLMMEKAILRNEPLTKEELEINAEAMGLQFDVIDESEEEKYSRNQKESLDKYLGE